MVCATPFHHMDTPHYANPLVPKWRIDAVEVMLTQIRWLSAIFVSFWHEIMFPCFIPTQEFFVAYAGEKQAFSVCAALPPSF